MGDISKGETDFLLQRAEQEAILAIRTDHPGAVATHFSMSLHYVERARAALGEENDPRPSTPTGNPAP